jgi:pimeloyl-ACP methyl ester carboxylesterase
MTLLSDLGTWISQNESLLSGMAAIIVLAGVLFSPIGAGLRRLGRGHAVEADATPSPNPGSAGGASSGTEENPRKRRLTLQDLTRPSPHPIRFAQSDGVRIAYSEVGSGPPLVMAPGIFSHLHVLSNLPSSKATAEALGEFVHVIMFDKRGQGLSDPTLRAPDLDERTRDIEAVMDASGTERAVLLGYSEGGPMCLNFAAANPDRVQGLVLVGTTSTWVQSEDFPIGLPRGVLERVTEAWGKGTLRDVFFPSISRDEVDDETYRAFERLVSNRTAIRQLVQMMIETDVRPLFPYVTVPTLVVHFAGDLAVPVRMGRALAEGLPNAEFLEVSGVDHADLSQSPEAIERIREFCAQVTAPA